MSWSALGKGLVNISIVVAIVALRFIMRKQRHKSTMPRVTKTIEESAISWCRHCRNHADNETSKNDGKCEG